MIYAPRWGGVSRRDTYENPAKTSRIKGVRLARSERPAQNHAGTMMSFGTLLAQAGKWGLRISAALPLAKAGRGSDPFQRDGDALAHADAHRT